MFLKKEPVKKEPVKKEPADVFDPWNPDLILAASHGPHHVPSQPSHIKETDSDIFAELNKNFIAGEKIDLTTPPSSPRASSSSGLQHNVVLDSLQHSPPVNSPPRKKHKDTE